MHQLEGKLPIGSSVSFLRSVAAAPDERRMAVDSGIYDGHIYLFRFGESYPYVALAGAQKETEALGIWTTSFHPVLPQLVSVSGADVLRNLSANRDIGVLPMANVSDEVFDVDGIWLYFSAAAGRLSDGGQTTIVDFNVKRCQQVVGAQS